MGGIDEHRLDLRFDGDALAMVLATPSRERARGVVVMLHGGPGGQKDGPDGLYYGLAGALGTEGIASLRFDFRGVGESGGRYRDMTIERQTAEYEAVCSLARAWGFARLGVVGESYGATIALRSAQAKLDVVCLLWPAVYFLDGTFSPFVVPEKV